jgi:hypothetical protein
MFLGRSPHTNLCLSKIERKRSKLDLLILALSQTYKLQEPKDKGTFIALELKRLKLAILRFGPLVCAQPNRGGSALVRTFVSLSLLH